MDLYYINNDQVIYEDSTHQYFVNGVETMSITTAMKLVNDKYKEISPKVLANAQMRGNEVHFQISMFEEYNVEPDIPTQEFISYKVLKNAFKFKYLNGEQIVIIRHRGITLVGRYDLKLEIDNECVLTDVKTTSHYDKKSVALQTELDALGHNQSYPNETPVTTTAGIHLNGKKRKFDRFLPTVNLELFFDRLIDILEKQKEEIK
jgi:hypothetical protein